MAAKALDQAAGWSLEDPGDIETALERGAKESFVPNGQRHMVEILGEGAEVDVAQATAEAFE